jgi:vancomycin resistance protein YoaR
MDAAIRSGRHTGSLGARRIKPGITTAAARKADHLIGTFTTHYAPGEPRVRNIQRIARAIDGTVIAPGAQFSLNGIAGPRTRAKGYVPAPFIAEGNRLEPSVGGGVSQFSTTTYNAAYFAGLQIDTHQPHSLFIDRYPAGRESTLNYPNIDLKWTNDTDVPVLVRSTADATSVTVSLYGDNGGRRVRAESGKREPVPGGDFSVVVTRVVRYPDGRTERQPFTTRYGVPAGGE